MCSLPQLSFDLSEYTANVDGLGTLRLLDAIRTCGLESHIKLYQVCVVCVCVCVCVCCVCVCVCVCVLVINDVISNLEEPAFAIAVIYFNIHGITDL